MPVMSFLDRERSILAVLMLPLFDMISVQPTANTIILRVMPFDIIEVVGETMSNDRAPSAWPFVSPSQWRRKTTRTYL